MISVITCSATPALAAAIAAHYHRLLGDEPHEVIVLDDARSLAEAYNRGIARASGNLVIFSHDDIEFLAPDGWLTRLREHLSRFDLVGLAGTTRLIGAAWAKAGPPYTFGRVGELDGQYAPYRALICGVPGLSVAGIVAVDGLFFAVRRSVLDRVRFDKTTFDGFHGYDIDFSFSAHLAGFRLGVATDLPVLHASQGNFDDTWERYAARFLDKHRARLHPMPARLFQHAIVCVNDKAELLDVLSATRI